MMTLMSSCLCSPHLDAPLPGGRGLPGEGEGVARLPRAEDHVVTRVLAADDRGTGPVILSREPGLEIWKPEEHFNSCTL